MTVKRRQQQGRRIPTGMQTLVANMDKDAIASVLPIEQVFHSPFNRILTVLVPTNRDHRVGSGIGIDGCFFSHGSCHSSKLQQYRRRRRTEMTEYDEGKWKGKGKLRKGEWGVGLITIVLLNLGIRNKKGNTILFAKNLKSNLWLLKLGFMKKIVAQPLCNAHFLNW